MYKIECFGILYKQECNFYILPVSLCWFLVCLSFWSDFVEFYSDFLRNFLDFALEMIEKNLIKLSSCSNSCYASVILSDSGVAFLAEGKLIIVICRYQNPFKIMRSIKFSGPLLYKRMTLHLVYFDVPVNQRVKINKNQKINTYLDLASDYK